MIRSQTCPSLMYIQKPFQRPRPPSKITVLHNLLFKISSRKRSGREKEVYGFFFFLSLTTSIVADSPKDSNEFRPKLRFSNSNAEDPATPSHTMIRWFWQQEAQIHQISQLNCSF